MVPKQSTSWNDARRYCEAIRADLAVIPDQHTLNVLIDIALREGISSFHVGLARHPDNLLSFRWVDGSPLVFAKWQAYEPNNMNEQCVVYNVDSAGYNDIDCDGNPKAFVCQQPMEGLYFSFLTYRIVWYRIVSYRMTSKCIVTYSRYKDTTYCNSNALAAEP